MPNHAHAQQVSAAVGGSGVRTDYDSDAASSAYPQGISTGDVGGGGSHYHSIGSSTQNTSSVGSDSSFSILPPYKAVYIWTRTA